MRFEGHEGDVNAVRFFPNGEALGTACNDGSVSVCVCGCVGGWVCELLFVSSGPPV